MKISTDNYLLLNFLLIILVLTLFNGCQPGSTITEPSQQNKDILEKDPNLRIFNTYVHGYVDDGDGKAAKYATIKLFDSSWNELTSTTADGVGYYNMLICPWGYGFRTVEATYSGDTGTNHFTFVFGTWDYTVDVTIGSHPDSNND